MMGNFHKIIHTLIFLNSELRKTERVKKQKILLPPIYFVIEYATVKVDIGRQSGKSEFIRQNSDDKTLIVVRKYIAKEEYRDCSAVVLTPSEVMKYCQQNRIMFERIYFDEPSYLFASPRERDEVYHSLVRPEGNQTFVHIGC